MGLAAAVRGVGVWGSSIAPCDETGVLSTREGLVHTSNPYYSMFEGAITEQPL